MRAGLGTFKGAAKFYLYLKIWKGEEHFEGKKFYCRENYKGQGKKNQASKEGKKDHQKFMGLVGKNLESAVNSKSAADGRHPSYATEHRPSICYLLVLA